MCALHYVAGYEAGRETEGIYVRAEGFVKTYADLPLEDGVQGYVADGYGSARRAPFRFGRPRVVCDGD